jgi:hypothetical protein
MAAGETVSVVPSFGVDRSQNTSRFGSTPITLDQRSTVYGLRTSWSGLVVDKLRGTIGLDVELIATTVRRAGSIGTPPREGDARHFGQPPPEQVGVDDWKTVTGSLAPYGELDLPLFDDRLHIVPGARVEPYLTNTSRVTPKVGETPALGSSRQETAVEPRLAIRFAATPRIAIRAGYGLYHQTPLPEDLSAVFGSPTLGLQSAHHVLVGGAFRLTPAVDLELTEFATASEGLVTRSRASSPVLAGALQQDGLGRSYGSQLLVRHRRVRRFFGWLAYSIVRSERRDSSDERWRSFDFDQSHVLTALGGYDLGYGFDVGLRVRYATGFPRTPVRGAYYDVKTDSYAPIFGDRNTIRLPPFFAIDVRVSKRLRVGETEGELYLDLQNATNRSNPEEIVYSPTYATTGYITGLPILPVVGARWSW